MGYKLFLVRLFTFLGGLYFFLEFLLPEQNPIVNFQPFHEYVGIGFGLVANMAIGLGLINVIFVHGGKVVFKKSLWIYSAILLLGLFTMLTVQSLDWYRKERSAGNVSGLVMLRDFSRVILEDAQNSKATVLPRSEREQALKEAALAEVAKVSSLVGESQDTRVALQQMADAASNVPLSDEQHKIFQERAAVAATLSRETLDKKMQATTLSQFAVFLNQGLFVSLGSAMFALLGFYIASAAYRAFRIRSIEASLMMLTALVVMLGQISFGVWISPHLPEIRRWLLQYPSTAASRAIEMGAGIAGLILAVRMWLSLEAEHKVER